MSQATWQPHDEPAGQLDAATREALPASAFAFPAQRKEPLTSASHVRDAAARFDQVEGVSEADRELAWANIRAAALHYGITLTETDWRQLGRRTP